MRKPWIAVILVSVVCIGIASAQIVIKPTPPPNKPLPPHRQIGTTTQSGTTSTAANKPAAEPWSIEGSVYDTSGQDDKGIPGATVNCGGKGTFTTDGYGHFKIDGLDRTKTYMLRVSKTGYTFSPDGSTVHAPNQGRVTNVRFNGTPAAKPKK